MKTKLIIYFAILPLVFGCHEGKTTGEFILRGKLKGKTTRQVIISYQDSVGTAINDTLPISNGEFNATGKINGATLVSLTGNTQSQSVEDPNYLAFFIDPDRKTSIHLEENKFKEATFEGSPTQREFENLEKVEAPIYATLEPLIKERDKLMEELNRVDSDPKIINQRLGEIRSTQINELDKIRKVRLDFIKNNPESYLSAYYLDRYYFSSISLDSVESYYNSFNPTIKNCLYGKELKLKIENSKTPSATGDIAPDFKIFSQNGDEISLLPFKGKYVLLDFWASWCGPCRKHNPDLKLLYELYHPKGLEIIGLSSDQDKNAWKNAIYKDDIGGWQHGLSGTSEIEISANYNVEAIPAYILIDRNGLIVGRYLAADNNFGFKDLKEKLKNIFE